MTPPLAALRADRDQKRIAAAINRRVQSGRPFTVDSIWGRLPDIRPGEHQSWVGQMIQKLSQAGRIRKAGFVESERARQHSRAIPLWVGIPEDERVKEASK